MARSEIINEIERLTQYNFAALEVGDWYVEDLRNPRKTLCRKVGVDHYIDGQYGTLSVHRGGEAKYYKVTVRLHVGICRAYHQWLAPEPRKVRCDGCTAYFDEGTLRKCESKFYCTMCAIEEDKS